MFDVIVRNGWLVDGTGNPRYRADVAIIGDRISAVGQLASAQAELEIDASGKMVFPGLIDAHSHTDTTIMSNPTAESSIRQGITTEVVGNCGGCKAFSAQRGVSPSGSPDYLSFAEFLNEVESMGTSNNLAWLVGHNSIRKRVGVEGPLATEDQLIEMGDLIRSALQDGALGLSTGLEFEPGRWCPPEEITRLAAHIREYDGIYASHIRNRDADVLKAMDEFLHVVRTHCIRGQVSHLNIRHNTGAPADAWRRSVQKIEEVRDEGFEVLTDMTPLNSGIGLMAGVLPPWLREAGVERAVEMLQDPQVRLRLRGECDRYWRFIHRGEWDRVRMQSNPAFPEINGLGFIEISQRWQKDPWDCYFDILAAAREQMDEIILVARLFTDEHLRETISHPLYMLVVDGYSTRIDGPLAEETAFPLHYMGMTHFLTHHVKSEHTLCLEEAIRKMTSMPATHFRLQDRGLLKKGCYADLVVCDYEKLDTVSTEQRPHAYVQGVEQVFVNGKAVISNGQHTGARPGRTLRR